MKLNVRNQSTECMPGEMMRGTGAGGPLQSKTDPTYSTDTYMDTTLTCDVYGFVQTRTCSTLAKK